MNKLLKIYQNDDKRVLFVSDTHYNHNPAWENPLWKARGYNSVDEMNADIITKINENVREDDVLFHLGDITLNCDEAKFEEFITQVKCKNIYLLWGNHNNPSYKIYRRQLDSVLAYNPAGGTKPLSAFENISVEVYPIRYKNIVFLGNYQEVVVDGQYIVLCHYPIYVFNYMKDNAWHLCGHSHCNLPLSQKDNTTAKILDVGWEGLKRPYTMSDIRAIMNTKNVLKVDHHV